MIIESDYDESLSPPAQDNGAGTAAPRGDVNVQATGNQQNESDLQQGDSELPRRGMCSR